MGVVTRHRDLLLRSRGSIPHALAVDSPGSSRIRRLARPEGVRRAGHRLDGEAAPATSGSGSPVKTMQVAVALVHPERERRHGRRVVQLDAREAVGVAFEVGVRVVELRSRRSPGQRGSRTRCPRPAPSDREAALVGDEDVRRHAQAESVDRRRSERQVRVLPASVGAWLRTDVRGRRVTVRPCPRARTRR